VESVSRPEWLNVEGEVGDGKSRLWRSIYCGFAKVDVRFFLFPYKLHSILTPSHKRESGKTVAMLHIISTASHKPAFRTLRFAHFGTGSTAPAGSLRSSQHLGSGAVTV
jgi:hypothetical protein